MVTNKLNNEQWKDIFEIMNELITTTRTFYNASDFLKIHENVNRNVEHYSDLELKKYVSIFLNELEFYKKMRALIVYFTLLGMPNEYSNELISSWHEGIGWQLTQLIHDKEKNPRLQYFSGDLENKLNELMG